MSSELAFIASGGLILGAALGVFLSASAYRRKLAQHLRDLEEAHPGHDRGA